MEGRYYAKKVYYPNGQLKETIDCVGALGTCTMNSRHGTSGENVTLNPLIIDESESGNIRSINAELLKSDIGVLYAINKKEYAEDCEFFFDSEVKEITGALVIDNPTILEELGISEAITIQGQYQVYENEEYQFIIIHER